MELNINEIIKQIQKKINPATFKKAVISKVNIQSNTADVYFIENPQNIIKSVPFATTIDPSKISPGTRCRVDCFDETNPSDMVIAYGYGGGTSFSSVKSDSGNTTVGTGGTAISHSLGDIPSLVTFTLAQDTTWAKSYAVTGGGGGNVNVTDLESQIWEYQDATSTHIYLKSTHANISVNWRVVKFT